MALESLLQQTYQIDCANSFTGNTGNWNLEHELENALYGHRNMAALTVIHSTS